VAAAGKRSRAKTVHANQVFSQAQRLVNFMGKVKLAFIKPAMIKRRKPNSVLFMCAFRASEPAAPG
jgi:hypothetical protein